VARAGAAETDRARELAVADALVGVGRALTTLGLRLRELDDDAPPVAAPLPVEVASAGAVPRGGVEPRQLAVLSLGGLGTDRGMSAGEVATAAGLTQPNAQNVLKRLEGLGYLTRVVGERPARWRREQ
jgi:DNA-binding transcriptional ArsR family regulator